MTRAWDLYGFGTFDPESVDNRHLLLCPGCHVCRMAEEQAERNYFEETA